MKILIFILLMTVAISSVNAKEAKKHARPVSKISKDKKMKVVDVEEGTKKEAPCETDAKELMKKLEEEQKKKAAKGQAFSLQGNNSSGCTIGN